MVVIYTRPRGSVSFFFFFFAIRRVVHDIPCDLGRLQGQKAIFNVGFLSLIWNVKSWKLCIFFQPVFCYSITSTNLE